MPTGWYAGAYTKRSGGDWSDGVFRTSGPWTRTVKRSLITLKALTYQPPPAGRHPSHHFAAGMPRRREELGLSLLLVAGSGLR